MDNYNNFENEHKEIIKKIGLLKKYFISFFFLIWKLINQVRRPWYIIILGFIFIVLGSFSICQSYLDILSHLLALSDFAPKVFLMELSFGSALLGVGLTEITLEKHYNKLRKIQNSPELIRREMAAMNFGADCHRFLKFIESKEKYNKILLKNVYNEYIEVRSKIFSELAESFLGQTAISHNLSNKTPIASIMPMELYKNIITSIRIANNTSYTVDCFNLGFWLENVRCDFEKYLSKPYLNGKILNKSIKKIILPVELEDKNIYKYITKEFNDWGKRCYVLTDSEINICYFILIYLTELDDIMNEIDETDIHKGKMKQLKLIEDLFIMKVPVIEWSTNPKCQELINLIKSK